MLVSTFLPQTELPRSSEIKIGCVVTRNTTIREYHAGNNWPVSQAAWSSDIEGNKQLWTGATTQVSTAVTYITRRALVSWWAVT
jgi:hypothetical protein